MTAAHLSPPWTAETRPTGGRPKGGLNRTTAALKAAILHAFDTVGREKYLVRLARSDEPSDRKAFCMLLSRILPAEVKAELTIRTWEDMLHEVAKLRAKPQTPMIAGSNDAPVIEAQIVSKANDPSEVRADV